VSWAKLDDRFAGNRKVRRAWKREPASIGLYVFALTYCAQHETDGLIDPEFVEDIMPTKKDRERAVAVLLDVGLWEQGEDGYMVHDYLDYQPSRASAEVKRAQKSKRQQAWRERQRDASTPGARDASVDASTPGARDASVDAAPTRPDPTRPFPPRSPRGGRARDREAWVGEVTTWIGSELPELSLQRDELGEVRAVKAVGQAIDRGATNKSEVLAFLNRWWPQLVQTTRSTEAA
jgi:hypothetical protein